MKRSSQIVLILLLTVAGAGMVWNHYRPRLYKAATSPDRSWSVKIMRQRHLGVPFFSQVNVIAVVENPEGDVLLRTTFDTVDHWPDVPTLYSEVICKDDRILVGPEYWDGARFGHFEIAKADLRAMTPDQRFEFIRDLDEAGRHKFDRLLPRTRDPEGLDKIIDPFATDEAEQDAADPPVADPEHGVR